jgi:hypothetical protein
MTLCFVCTGLCDEDACIHSVLVKTDVLVQYD